MAEGMAKKAWHFAQSAGGASSSPATPSKGRRSYSTATSPSVTPGIVYTCIHTYTMYTHTFIYIHTFTHTQTHTCTHTHTHICTHTHAH